MTNEQKILKRARRVVALQDVLDYAVVLGVSAIATGIAGSITPMTSKQKWALFGSGVCAGLYAKWEN